MSLNACLPVGTLNHFVFFSESCAPTSLQSTDEEHIVLAVMMGFFFFFKAQLTKLRMQTNLAHVSSHNAMRNFPSAN